MGEHDFIRIAVCDDEKEIRDSIEKNIRLLYADAEVILFENGNSLLAYPGQLDILFLDIQMQPIDGMETARELRRSGNHVTIIFVTAIEEYVFQAFDVQAFHYLVKPFGREKFFQVLRRAVEERKELRFREREEKPAIVIKQGSMTQKVYLCEILYAEVYNRKVVIHKKDGDIEYYGKLGDLEKQAGKDFFRTHRAYLVNLQYIIRYDARTVWMEKGQALMAKQNYPEFVKRYLEFNRKEIYNQQY